MAYQDVVGLQKFCRNGFSCNNSGDITQGVVVNPFTFEGAVAVIVIFILVNFQLKLLYSQVRCSLCVQFCAVLFMHQCSSRSNVFVNY